MSTEERLARIERAVLSRLPGTYEPGAIHQLSSLREDAIWLISRVRALEKVREAILKADYIFSNYNAERAIKAALKAVEDLK